MLRAYACSAVWIVCMEFPAELYVLVGYVGYSSKATWLTDSPAGCAGYAGYESCAG